MVDCGRDECQKKKNRLIAGYFWSIWSGSLRQGERQKPWMETRRTLTMSRVAPLKRNVKKTISAEWGAGAGAGAVSSLFVGPLGLIWSSGPSPRSATVIEVTLRQQLIKKKKFSTICLHFPRSEKKKKKTRLFSNWIIYFRNKAYYPAKPRC